MLIILYHQQIQTRQFRIRKCAIKAQLCYQSDSNYFRTRSYGKITLSLSPKKKEKHSIDLNFQKNKSKQIP